MKTIQNSIPKPLNWIWKVILKKNENKKILDLVYKLTGVLLKYGEIHLSVKNFTITKITIQQTTVVDVIDDDAQNGGEEQRLENTEKTANNAVENKA